MLSYGFYNARNGDRKYDALQLSSIFDGIITDGIFASVGGHLIVSAGTGMQVIVASGRAWFDHTWTLNDTDLAVAVQQSEIVMDRIDALVIEVNETDRKNYIKFVVGTPASSPQRPTLINTDEVHQHALAYVRVDAGVTSIAASKITNVIGTEAAPFITAPLQTVDVSELLQQWSGEFAEFMAYNDDVFTGWFEHLMIELSDDVAANLQRQIDEIQPMSTSMIDDCMDRMW